MDWTVTKIKAKVRDLTARPTTSQLSEADLLDYILNFYCNSFPLILETHELEGWYTKTLTTGVDTYELDEEYLQLDIPYTLDGKPLNFYENPSLFYRIWPESQTYSNAEPSHVLFYDRSLLFRPAPDLSTYEFKAACIKRPTAFTDDDGKPPNQAWGPVIAYGAAIDIFMDNGEQAEADKISGGFAYYLGLVNGQEIKYLVNKRSIPRF